MPICTQLAILQHYIQDRTPIMSKLEGQKFSWKLGFLRETWNGNMECAESTRSGNIPWGLPIIRALHHAIMSKNSHQSTNKISTQATQYTGAGKKPVASIGPHTCKNNKPKGILPVS